MSDKETGFRQGAAQTFIDRIYANHNSTARIRSLLGKCLGALADGSLGLDVGGRARLHPNLLTLNISLEKGVDCVGDAEATPFRDEAFSLVVTQETLEHLPNPERAIAEIHRVLRPGGLLFCQLPFVIGYHPGPYDFWRFTKEGIVCLVEGAGFVIEESHISVGPAFGFYHICVEFLAIMVSSLIPRRTEAPRP